MTLDVRNLVKKFAGVQAVSDVSFQLQPGECVALIGPNGAGKSTTFACIAGQQQATSGEVVWNGVSVQCLSALERLHLGIARTFQVAQVFESLTVFLNVQLASHASSGLPFLNRLDSADSTVTMHLIGRLGLTELADVIAGRLPYGAKKRLELAIALAGLHATRGGVSRLLLLDEPAAGLAASERHDLMMLIRSLAKPFEGGASDSEAHDELTVLYTEHNMDAVFGVADRVLVLMEGRLVAQGSPEEVAGNAIVRERYLGRGFQYGASHAES